MPSGAADSRRCHSRAADATPRSAAAAPQADAPPLRRQPAPLAAAAVAAERYGDFRFRRCRFARRMLLRLFRRFSPLSPSIADADAVTIIFITPLRFCRFSPHFAATDYAITPLMAISLPPANTG
jgi:hypothetical protein